MFLELHIIQNFAPSNLNRDDTNSPKDCVFGGYRRARISSQCIKRAIRRHFRDAQLIDESNLAVRTKRLVEEVSERLATSGKDKEQARAVVAFTLAGAELKVAEDGKTQYLLYLGADEIRKIADLCEKHWENLSPLAGAKKEEPTAEGAATGKAKKNKAKVEKKDAKELVPKEIRDEITRIFGSVKASDLALFGRMLADMPEKNIDASCQVAHAISTNEVAMEMDFYTAVDDLKPEDTQGADMMGVVEFNSSCFYRYMVVDVDKLRENLIDDAALSKKTMSAFVSAAIDAVPTGKQNSMAAHNPPLYVRTLVRKSGQPWNLANAFLRPVRTPRDAARDIAELSVLALESHLEALQRMYGKDGIAIDEKASVYDAKSLTVPGLVSKVMEALG